MKRKWFAISIIFLLLTACMFGCGLSSVPPETQTESESGKLSGANHPTESDSETLSEPAPYTESETVSELEEGHPYLSITYGRNSSESESGREIVYYTYDLVTDELREECVLPYDADYACGVVSRAAKTVYYSSRATPNDPSSNDSLWAYDIETKKAVLLETGTNRSYNSITLMGDNQLLVMAATKEHPIQPALFDLETDSFTYLSDVNKEPRDLYTCGPTRLSYNYKTHEIVFIYQKEAEIYSPEYMRIKQPADVFLSIASEHLVKEAKPVWTQSLLLTDQVEAATRLSENEFWVVITHYNPEAEDESDFYKTGIYSLKLEGDTSTLTPIDFPYSSSSEWNTVDEGETFYFLMVTEECPQRGLYSYCPKTKEIRLILSGDSDATGHVINYSILGPEN